MAVIFDLETDGFLDVCTTIHCIVLKDTEDGEVFSYSGSDVASGITHLSNAFVQGKIASGHNVIKFDLPIIKKLYPWFTYEESQVFDTLVATRVIYSNLQDLDAPLIKAEKLPSKLWGSQSLAAWGYRLMEYKGDYEGGWGVFTPEMLAYCVQDVEVTQKLYEKILSKSYSAKALKLEHEVAFICSKMERSGWPFNVEAAGHLYAKLAGKRDSIQKQMLDTFEPEVIERVSEKTGKPLKTKVIEFNPSSRKQIGDRLTRKYGWKPSEYTPNGQPKIDETTLRALEYPEAQLLADYFLLEKRIGQLAEGDNSWLKLERNGKIHGGYNTCGTVTGRSSHQTPNLAQVPSVRSLYGAECRSLFTVPLGFALVGCDLSGLELRCLAHFTHRWDAGSYGETVVNGKASDGTDIHSVNQRAAGLATRDDAKKFIYTYLYGGGDEKVGSLVGGGSKEGRKLKEQFLTATPALKQLRDAVGAASKRGYLVGLDGRHIHIRSEHAALNSLLQSAGALIAKQWLVEIVAAAQERGWKWSEDWSGDWVMCGWVHDEVQIAVKEEYAEEFGKMVVACSTQAGEFFDFKVPIGAEYCTGLTWSDTH